MPRVSERGRVSGEILKAKLFRKAGSSASTSSTSFVNLMSLSFVLKKRSVCLFQATLPWASNSVKLEDIYFRLLLDGSVTGSVMKYEHVSGDYVTAGSDIKPITLLSNEIVEAGSHTLTLQWRVTGGTANMGSTPYLYVIGISG